MPELLRAFEPFVNNTTTDLAHIGPGSRPFEASVAEARSATTTYPPGIASDATLRRFVAPLEVTTHAPGDTAIDAAQFDRFGGAHESSGSVQSAFVDHLNAARPRLAEPESLFPRADYSSGRNVPAASGTHSSGRIETGWADDFSGAEHSASRAGLTQTPLGDTRSLEGRSGGSSTLDGGGTETIAELAARLLQAATRLEHLAQRYSADAPRSYRSTPGTFRDRVEG
jgi:hypothetical protein